MPSDVDIVNQALIRIGQNTIDSLTSTDPKAVKANAIYTLVRDEIFASHPWNSLVQRATLAQLADAPDFGFDYQYSLPVDFVRIVQIKDNPRYKIEHYDDGAGNTYRVLLSNETPIKISYVARITDPNRWDVLLRSAVSFRMSAELAQSNSGSDSMVQRMWAYYEKAMAEAQFSDSSQHWSLEKIQPTKWINARFTRGGTRFLPKLDTDGQPL